MVALLIGTQTMGTVCSTTLPAIAPEVAGALGVPSRLIGYQIALHAGAMLVSFAFGGGASQRYGACRVSQIAIAMFGGGTALCMIPNVAAIAFGTLLMGLGYGLVTPAASHLLMRHTPAERRNVVFSIKQTGVPIGGMIAATVQPAVAVYFGWQYALALAAAVSIALGVVLQRYRTAWDGDRDPSARALTNPVASIAIAWRDPGLRYFSFAGCLLVIAQVCMFTFTVVMFAEDVGYSLIAAGFVLTMSHAGGVLGRVLWGWAADRWGNCIAVLQVLAIVMAAGVAACASLGAGWPLLLVHVLFFVLGSTASGWNGAFLAEIARLAPSGNVGAGTGGALVLVNTGQLFGPLFVAQAYLFTGSYSTAFATIAVPSLLAFWVLGMAGRRIAAGVR